MVDDLADGHVYVAHGRIESVVHDVAVVPTDASFEVSESWEPVVRDLAAGRPSGWAGGGHARSAQHDDVWFVDVVSDVEEGRVDILLKRVEALLADIAAEPPEVGAGRTQLRVAMPLLGVEGGGLAAQKGEVVRELLATLTEGARRHGCDVVLVTPEASVFAAAQHVRREHASWPLPDDVVGDARRLGDLATRGHLALFVGGGASIPAGLPAWSRLLEELARRAGISSDDFGRLPPLDQAQLLEKRLGDTLGDHVVDLVGGATRPSLAHVLLAGLQCRHVVTTNYDDLYERAVAASGGPVVRVLPWQDSEPGHPWVLKMHGDLAQPESIVLTRRQFVRYDAATRPAGSVLQALLLTEHLLVVGASLNDDNVSRLTHEVDEFRRERGLQSRFGTFLDVGGHRSRRELWSDQLSWISLPGASSEERARSLEVFLDCVAAHGVRDHSWFLDERFAGLLDDDARALAVRARELHAEAERVGAAAAPLAETLRALGVAAGE